MSQTKPDPKVETILNEIVEHHFHGVLSEQDNVRCRGLLNDLAGDYRLEVNLLSRALDIRIPQRIATNNSPLSLIVPRLVQELQDIHGITVENALWAVETWGSALGTMPNPSDISTETKQIPEATDSGILQQSQIPSTGRLTSSNKDPSDLTESTVTTSGNTNSPSTIKPARNLEEIIRWLVILSAVVFLVGLIWYF